MSTAVISIFSYMYITKPWLISLLLIIIAFSSCSPDEDPIIEPFKYDSVYSGGSNFTSFVSGENAFGAQGSALTTDESRFFVSGNSLFRNNWVIAPASVPSLDGIGPLYNAISCGSCHFKDGRAAPPIDDNILKPGLLFRLSVPGTTIHGEPLPHSIYGGQLQDNSNPNIFSEAQVNLSYDEILGLFSDGSEFVLNDPVYNFSNFGFGPFSQEMLFSPRIAPQIIGLGLLEAISEDDILRNEDPGDSNNDGISGRANYVYDYSLEQFVLGRFGWKAGQPSLDQQNAAAFNGDMGLTTDLFPKDDLTDYQTALYPDLISGGEPEVSEHQISRMGSYVKALAVPARRNTDKDLYYVGKDLFDDLQCSSCHIPSFNTSFGNEITSLDGQEIYPYTDLLLHDMGPGLADNRPEFLADGSEWRTPPLWGIGLIPVVNGHSQLLHDGRASSVEEAILWHGGEAEQSKNFYVDLTEEEREALIFFVNSL